MRWINTNHISIYVGTVKDFTGTPITFFFWLLEISGRRMFFNEKKRNKKDLYRKNMTVSNEFRWINKWEEYLPTGAKRGMLHVCRRSSKAQPHHVVTKNFCYFAIRAAYLCRAWSNKILNMLIGSWINISIIPNGNEFIYLISK